ncbi:MAG: hypothetical protein ABIH83_01760, partial [Candidatus Micrarchaeota archaeon]
MKFLKKAFVMVLCLFFLSPVFFASQTYIANSGFEMYHRSRSFSTDAVYSLKMTLSSNPNNPKIFIPRTVDRSDLPNIIYMCPGSLNFETDSETVWFDSYFDATSSYPQPNERPDKICLAYPNPCGNIDCCEETEWPWDTESTLNPIQWNTNDDLIDRIRSDSSRAAERDTDTYEWGIIYTAGQNVNVDYYPFSNLDLFYPNQQAEGGLVCKGYEELNINNNPVTRSDGDLSPSALQGYPLREHSWNLPSFANTGSDNIVLGPITYTGTIYTLEGKIQRPERCVGIIHSLPDWNDAYDRKFYYSQGEYGYATLNEPDFRVYAVDPDSCEVKANAYAPATLRGSALTPGAKTIVKVSITNPYELFDLRVTDVRMTVPTTTNWQANPAPELPENYFYDSPYYEEIYSGETEEVLVELIAPTPPEDIDELCFELTIESAVEFCDGEICSSELELCLIVDPKFYCE